MLNNMCESLNSKIVEGRDVPIITCLEYIKEYLMKKTIIHMICLTTATTSIDLKPNATTCKQLSQKTNPS